jgi:hypothetical protein
MAERFPRRNPLKKADDWATCGDVWKMIKGFELELIAQGRLAPPPESVTAPEPSPIPVAEHA